MEETGEGAHLPSGCAAPRASLYFRPDGAVTACCASWHVLGWVTGPERRSLHEIWEGQKAAALRAAIDARDFSLGCWECGIAIEHGDRSMSVAANHDRFASDPLGTRPRFVDFALSNRCNLQCQMCNGGLSSAIRRQREGRPPLPSAYDDRFFDELDEFLPYLSAATFKGGEPFLARENRRIWDRMIEIGGPREVGVTTNGTVLNPSVERYIRELGLDLTISVDAMSPHLLASIRVGIDPVGFWANVDRFQAIAEETGAEVRLAFCLMAQNWWELGPFLAETERRGVRHSIIWVDGPGSFRFLGLPGPDLAKARHDYQDLLESGGASAGTEASLVDALRRVESEIERRGDGAEGVVSLRNSTSAAVTWRRQAESARRDLVARTQGQPLELTYESDVVVAIDAPFWADSLEPKRWMGSGLEQFVTLLADAVVGNLRSTVEPLDGGFHRVVFSVDSDLMPGDLVAYYMPSAPQATTSTVLLAPAVPAQTVAGNESAG